MEMYKWQNTSVKVFLGPDSNSLFIKKITNFKFYVMIDNKRKNNEWERNLCIKSVIEFDYCQ